MKKRLKGSITELIKNQKYRICVNMGYDPATKTYPKKRHIFYGTRDEAQAYLRDWLNELENPEEEYAQETVSQWLDSWLENDAKVLLKWEQNTRKRKVQIIDNNIKPYIGDVLLPDLDADTILKMYSDLKKEGLASRTLRHIHATLNQSLNHAVKRKKIPLNPAQGLTPALSLEDDKDNWVVLNQKQLNAFLENIKAHALYTLIFTAAYTGARQSELLGLTWNKVLWKKKAIRIEQALHRDDEAESGFELRPRTKRRGSKRTIDVSSKVIELLKELKKQQEESGYKGDHVFVKPDGQFYDASILSRSFGRLTKKHGHKGMTFHHLRHTHATILLSHGAYINEVAARLGHTDPRTTFALYGHVMPGREATLAQFFDKVMNENSVSKTCLIGGKKYRFKSVKRWSKGDKKTTD